MASPIDSYGVAQKTIELLYCFDEKMKREIFDALENDLFCGKPTREELEISIEEYDNSITRLKDKIDCLQIDKANLAYTISELNEELERLKDE